MRKPLRVTLGEALYLVAYKLGASPYGWLNQLASSLYWRLPKRTAAQGRISQAGQPHAKSRISHDDSATFHN